MRGYVIFMQRHLFMMNNLFTTYKLKTGIIVSYLIAVTYNLPVLLINGNISYFLISHIVQFLLQLIAWILCVHFTNDIDQISFKKLIRNKKIWKYYLSCEVLVLIGMCLMLLSRGIYDFSALNWKITREYLIYIHLNGMWDFTIILLVVQSMNFFSQREKTNVEKENIAKENAKSKFEALRQQLNPHFLFNSLTSLKALIATNSADAEKYVVQLSGVYRYLIKHRSSDVVMLQEEIEFIKSYLFLLKIRYEENVEIVFDIEDGYTTRLLVPLTLQLLLENAIKHNVISESAPLSIKVFTKDEAVVVWNTFQPRDEVEGSSNFGLYNLNQQYKFITGKEIDITKTETDFSVSVPLILPEKN